MHYLPAVPLTWSAKSSALPRNSRWFCMAPAGVTSGSPRCRLHTGQLAGRRGTKNNNKKTIKQAPLYTVGRIFNIQLSNTNEDILHVQTKNMCHYNNSTCSRKPFTNATSSGWAFSPFLPPPSLDLLLSTLLA